MRNILYTITGLLLLILVIPACSGTSKEKQTSIPSYTPRYDSLARHLVQTGDIDFFHRMDYKLVDSFWDKGKNEAALMEIVSQRHYDDLARLLASEILFHSQKNYPPVELEDTLGYVYARALYITGDTRTFPLMGNEWGFMYFNDKDGIVDYDALGSHLMKIGRKAVPYLKPLLSDTSIIVYWGSEEATIGNSLKYRVKDAAAYYIGKITGNAVRFYENNADRDAEIERLKKKL
jgi:hypothetical protein